MSTFLCRLLYVNCSMSSAQCSMSSAQCSMSTAQCSMSTALFRDLPGHRTSSLIRRWSDWRSGLIIGRLSGLITARSD